MRLPFRQFAAAAAVVLATPAVIRAQTPLILSNWSTFEWFLGVGPVEGNGFFLNALVPTQLRLVDGGFSGDAFDIFVNGNPLVSTPSVAGGIPTGAFDGNSAWNDSRLSRLGVLLNPGQYTITLAVREAGSGFDDGEGFIRADIAPTTPPVTTVPEPATAIFLALGLASIAMLQPAIRRRSNTTGNDSARGDE